MTSQSIKTGRYSSRQMETGLSVPEHDYIGVTNDANGNPTAVVYRAGGASGQIVSTVNMTYDANGYLSSVTKIS